MRVQAAGLLALVLGAAAPPPEEADARAAAVAETLRCVVCKNQSIADSDAALAEAMRDLVRERIEAGDTDAEVRAYLVARYGESVLLKPAATARNAWLWFLPPALLIAGALGAVAFVRGQRRTAAPPAPLSEAERAELDRLRSG